MLYRELCTLWQVNIIDKKRFKTAIQNLKKSKDNQKEKIPSQIRTVVMSIKESDSMKSLQTKLNEIDIMIESNSKQTSDILYKTKLSANEIKSKFDLFEQKLKERKKQLNIELHQQSNKILHKLKQKQDTLNNYKTSIQNGQKQQQSFIEDVNLDATKREIKMTQTSNNILNNITIEEDKFEATNDFIAFKVDSTKICEVLLFHYMIINPLNIIFSLLSA